VTLDIKKIHCCYASAGARFFGGEARRCQTSKSTKSVTMTRTECEVVVPFEGRPDDSEPPRLPAPELTVHASEPC
jgi:hypothetical protein